MTLPANVGLPPLEIGKNYNWTLKIICDSVNSDYTPFVEGWVQRVEQTQSLKTALSRAKPADFPSIYGSAGLWNDMLTALANLRRANPGDKKLKTDWQQLIDDVGLSKVSQEPLI